MNKTQNFQLNQWDAADRVQRADFNADNAALETALTNLSNRCNGEDASISSLSSAVAGHASTLSSHASSISALNTAVAGLQSSAVKMAFGSYFGNGLYSSAYPITLTFGFVPKLVIVQRKPGSTTATDSAEHAERQVLFLLNGAANFDTHTMSNYISLTWSGNSVSWYSNQSASAQLNVPDKQYFYVAFG